MIKTIGEIAYVTKLAGFEYTKYLAGNFINDGVPVIQGKNIKNHQLNLTDVKYISKELSDSLLRSRILNNDILFCYVANVGDCWLNEKNLSLHLGSNIAKIQVNSNLIIPKYLYYWLQSEKNFKYINAISKGSVQKNINMEEIRSLKIEIPNIELQQHIVNTISLL